MLRAERVSVRYPGAGRPAIDAVSLELVPRQLVAVVGPNGSGKTTLLRALLGAVPLTAGEAWLEQKPVRSWPARDRARRVGVVSQREDYPFAWRVEELVGFGRYAHLSPLAPLRRADRDAIDRALSRADVLGLRTRRIDTLSGGEWQRVRIARALAQEPSVLVLDEPTAALDLGHEMEIFTLISDLIRGGLAGVVVTHHLNLAARFADRIMILHQGRAVATGTPPEVFRADLLEQVFAWPVEITRVDGAPQVVAKRRSL
jgi:iron complex transport system ATP-binding protein